MSPFNVEDVVTVGVELKLLKVKADEGVMAVLTVPLGPSGVRLLILA